jgi:type IV pilus assembly protein PilF
MKYLVAIIIIILLSACSSNTLQYPSSKALASRTHVNLGLYYLQNGDLILAKSKLLLALEENPKDFLVNDAFGFFLETTGNVVLAKKYYQLAIKYAPNNGEALNNYGTFLYRQKDFNGALQYFLKATADLHYLYISKANNNAALVAYKLNNPKLARSYLAKAAKSQNH